MKYGINLLLWTDTLTDNQFPVLDTIKKIGYDIVELPMFDKDVANAARWGKKLDELGLLRSATCAYSPEDNLISNDPKIRQQGINTNKKILDCCAAAGCTVMAGNSISALGVFTGSSPKDNEWKWALDGMREVAEHAQNVGVKIAMEALNRFEAYFINCTTDNIRFAKELNHPAFGIMYDTFHANIEEKNVTQAIHDAKDYLLHVHISENDRSTPGTGAVRWKETFTALHEIGYDDWLVVEAFGQALPKLAAATKIWRKMFVNELQLATDALAFMKEQVQLATS
ncbi:MAG: sugar phosphate isomerase/epimerase [Planctomycetaceae bacterium]|jgi:D-psicose/D-tagatose/L-ribulose 3-epimerase|nr:sugar phosphate isomerase/epimerase [Planctomycetaceae bacterium]